MYKSIIQVICLTKSKKISHSNASQSPCFSVFKCCSVTENRNLDWKIFVNELHKGTLRVVFKEYEKSYKDLLVNRDEISIHPKHLQFLATKVFKSTNKLNPQFLWCFFKNHEIPYNLRYRSAVELPDTNTTNHEKRIIKLQRCHFMEYKTLPEFKRRLKKH